MENFVYLNYFEIHVLNYIKMCWNNYNNYFDSSLIILLLNLFYKVVVMTLCKTLLKESDIPVWMLNQKWMEFDIECAW